MATFIGIDLAWVKKNHSGGAVIRGGKLIDARGDLGSMEEIVDFIDAYTLIEGGTVIGVDAPLRVPNQRGSRLCERQLNRDWIRFQAGAHPANRQLLARDGEVRGETLVALLTQRLRFSEAAIVPRHTQARLVCEIYPHPAHVSIFNLEKTLKYKRGRVDERRLEMARYQELLRGLRKAVPPLKKTKKILKRVDVGDLRGKALKQYEDTLDAISCAYIASYLWHHGPRRSKTYGSLAEGHIVVPVTKEMARKLDSIERSKRE